MYERTEMTELPNYLTICRKLTGIKQLLENYANVWGLSNLEIKFEDARYNIEYESWDSIPKLYVDFKYQDTSISFECLDRAESDEEKMAAWIDSEVENMHVLTYEDIKNQFPEICHEIISKARKTLGTYQE